MKLVATISILVVGLLVLATLLFPAFNADDERVSQVQMETSQLIVALREYKKEYGTFPSSDPKEIGRALTGNNPRKIIFIDFNKKSILPDGSLADTWGTPYSFYFFGDSILIRSAGKNKVFEEGYIAKSDDFYRW